MLSKRECGVQSTSLNFSPAIEFARKRDAASAQLRFAAGDVRLRKPTSNLFRDRKKMRAQRLDVRAFNRVLNVDATERSFNSEGMVSYGALTQATFAKFLLPPVVPQLKSITIGGAVAGLGIEASSFRYGLAHETALELEVLLADGEVVTCTADNQYRDLFFGLPNSYGTLGYALRVKSKAVEAKPYVALQHIRYGTHREYFDALEKWCSSDADFVDGVVFGPGEQYLTVGRFVDEAPYTSDYTFMNIFYRSIRERSEDYLSTLDFIWRWDTDWFWCSRVLGAQHPWVRHLLGRHRLNSEFYKKVANFNDRFRARQRLRRLMGIHQETVIQDVDIPITNAVQFLEFFEREVGLTPLWICPFRSSRRYTLFPTDPEVVYVNFGFWDAVTRKEAFEEGHFNRLIEHKVIELGGIKSLYSDSYFTHEEFWKLYNRDGYEALKTKYDPHHKLSDLYRKCVLRE
jgi:FAD/FMN-containing dehydrogenase